MRILNIEFLVGKIAGIDFLRQIIIEKDDSKGQQVLPLAPVG